MSGHSKFANIKHKKEKNDAAKGKPERMTDSLSSRKMAAVRFGTPWNMPDLVKRSRLKKSSVW